MRGMLTRVAVLAVAAAGCSASGTPATIPSSVSATTTVATTVAVLPTTTTSLTTTTEATTTTVDRRSEIEAIFQDLEERRLQALYDGDREAFKVLFANDEYLERSMGAFDVVKFEGAPGTPTIGVVDIVHDSESCIAAEVRFGEVSGVIGSDERTRLLVIERSGTAWGYSYSGEGWVCDGPHPFSP